MRKQRASTAAVWNHFDIIDHEEKKAICKYCKNCFSYRSTITNLKFHLRKKHIGEFKEIGAFDLRNAANVSTESASDDDSRPSNSLWSYFEREDSRARCAVCRAAVPPSRRALRDHLLRNHPKLLPDNEDSDQMEEDGEHYTEVVYLEDSVSEEPAPPSSRKRSEYVEKPRRSIQSPSTPERESKRSRNRDPDEEEIESFGAYVICLLKSLPKTVCHAVQRDIINTIMTAKLQKPDTEQVVIDGAQLLLKTASNKSFIMIDSTEKDCQSSDEGKFSFVKVSSAKGEAETSID